MRPTFILKDDGVSGKVGLESCCSFCLQSGLTLGRVWTGHLYNHRLLARLVNKKEEEKKVSSLFQSSRLCRGKELCIFFSFIGLKHSLYFSFSLFLSFFLHYRPRRKKGIEMESACKSPMNIGKQKPKTGGKLLALFSTYNKCIISGVRWPHSALQT